MRAVIFNNTRHDSIKALADSLGLEDKTIWNHLARGSEVADTGECVDYAFDPEDRMEIEERNNKLK